MIIGHHGCAISAVREQLIAEGWLHAGGRAVLAVPAETLELYDPCRVGALADQVAGALRTALAGEPAEPWLLACGLLAVHARLPGLADYVATADLRHLQQLARDAIPPISGLAEAIQNRAAW